MTASAVSRRFADEAIAVLLAIVAVKALFLLLDPNPRFFMWDTVTYLQGAIGGELPRDRSFFYSLLIEAIALPAHSLHALVIAQTIAGVASAFLAFVVLRRMLAVSYGFSLAAALLVAIGPSQLFYERMVMAEAFGSILWLGFIALVLAYCRDRRVWWLPAIALVGIFSVSFRLNGTMTVVVVGALLPLWCAWFSPKAESPSPGGRGRLFAHLVLAIVSTALVHGAYQRIVGRVAHTEPGYIGVEGVFKLGVVAPMVKAEDFAGTDCPPDILDRVTIPLHDPARREAQLWSPGGLWDVMQHTCIKPEAVATIVSRRALQRRPFELIPMAFSTVAQYFDGEAARWRMNSDLGRKELPLELIEPAKELFFLQTNRMPFVDTATSVLFEHSRWWMTACFFGLPALAILLLVIVRRERGSETTVARVLALIALLTFVSQFFGSHIISFRYLAPFPPLVIVIAFAIVARWRERRGAVTA